MMMQNMSRLANRFINKGTNMKYSIVTDKNNNITSICFEYMKNKTDDIQNINWVTAENESFESTKKFISYN